MSLFSFAKVGIRTRILALAIIPILSITLLSAVYNINSAIDNEHSSLQSRGEKLLVLAAEASQLALFAGDRLGLENLSSAIMRDSNVAAVLFYDDANKAVVQRMTKDDLRLPSSGFVDGENYIEGDYWYFVKAVQYGGESVFDSPEEDDLSSVGDFLGWVVLVVDLEDNKAYRAAVFRDNLLISLLMLMLALWLAFSFGRKIVTSITNITRAVNDYGEENFMSRVAEISSGELGVLEKGINSLAERVGYSQLILKEEVEKATGRWIDSVKILETQNEDLIEAKAAADQANKSKDIFLANMSHEIRTPLTSIIGFSELLLRDEGLNKEQGEDALNSIAGNSKHLLSLINDILDLSKVEADMLVLERENINLPSLLVEVENLVGDLARKKGLCFSVVYETPLPLEVVTDATRLKQILINLINNSIKFTSEGFVTLCVSVCGDFLKFTVEDSGVGIAEGDLNKIFRAFEQAEASTTRKFGGTGLGLNISNSLAEKLGGGITVRSELGEGSCFTVMVRHEEVQGSPLISSMDDVVKDSNSQCVDPVNNGLSGRVLLAEDQEEIRLLVTYFLESKDLTVVAVENGQDLLDVVIKEDFDLIFTDIQMPVMGGVEALTRLRQEKPNVPVIALTANAMDHEVQSYLDVGFTSYLSKPIDQSKFNEVLERYLSS